MMVQEEFRYRTWSEPFKKGDVQHNIFHEEDGPPFYLPNFDPNQYINKPKGIRQVLWERGLLKPDMTLDGNWVDGPGNNPVRDFSTSAHLTLTPSLRLKSHFDLLSSGADQAPIPASSLILP